MKGSWVEINLKQLAENVATVRRSISARAEIMFVVKANAYGHGLKPIARKAAECGIRWFAVAYVHEAVELRTALPDVEILILGAADAEDVPALFEYRLTPVVVSEHHARRLGEAAKRIGRLLPVHLKIDTGMGRLGIWYEEVPAVLDRLGPDCGLEIRGVCTHFATVELRKPAPARAQWERFDQALRHVEAKVGRRLFRHISSSRAALFFPDWDLDAVRPGIALYGYGTKDHLGRFHTRPILQWKTCVMQVKRVPQGFAVGYYSTYITPAPTTLATLSVGYADGYNRLLSNKGFVLLGGRRCPVVGRVSMNWITVDAGPDATVHEGDEAVLIGEQGNEQLWADEMAAACRTIPYEILTDINPTLPRVYLD